MSQEIIDYYRQANKREKGKPAIKQIIEQKTSEIAESQTNPQPEPFQTFVLGLAEKIQKDKQRQKKPNTVVNDSEKIITDSVQEPQTNFVEEKLKRAAALIIKELKASKAEAPVILEQQEQLPATEDSEEEPTENNSYVEELKQKEEKPKQIEVKQPDSQQTISQQVHKEIQKFLQTHPNFGMSGSGGGTNAVQYANGGVMRGDLDVTGKYLSGGVDLIDIFSTTANSALSSSDRLVSGSNQVILSSTGILTTNDNLLQTITLNTIGQFLSGGIDLFDLFASRDVIDGGTFS
jgi:hypothetical protein